MQKQGGPRWVSQRAATEAESPPCAGWHRGAAREPGVPSPRGGQVEIEGVISVYTIGDRGKLARPRQIIQNGKQFVLAEIAAVCGVGAIRRILHFMRFDEFVAHMELADEFFDHGTIVRGITWGERGDGQGATSQRAMRGPSQIGGVRSPRQRDEEGRKSGEPRKQKIFPLFSRKRSFIASLDLNELLHHNGEYSAECILSCSRRRASDGFT